MTNEDFFRGRLEQMIDLRHPLAVLAQRMPWSQIKAALTPSFQHREREGQVIEGEDLFGPACRWWELESAQRVGHACRFG